MIKIKWNDSGRAYGGFCVISDDNEQSGKFSSCKDYIQDLYTYYFNNQNAKGNYAFSNFGFDSSEIGMWRFKSPFSISALILVKLYFGEILYPKSKDFLDKP